MHQITKIYFVIKLYMFRASSVLIIRSYLLYTRQLVRCMRVMWPLPSRVRLECEFQPDGQRSCPKHVEFYDKINFGYLMHLVGCFIPSLLMLLLFPNYCKHADSILLWNTDPPHHEVFHLTRQYMHSCGIQNVISCCSESAFLILLSTQAMVLHEEKKTHNLPENFTAQTLSLYTKWGPPKVWLQHPHCCGVTPSRGLPVGVMHITATDAEGPKRNQQPDSGH